MAAANKNLEKIGNEGFALIDEIYGPRRSSPPPSQTPVNYRQQPCVYQRTEVPLITEMPPPNNVVYHHPPPPQYHNRPSYNLPSLHRSDPVPDRYYTYYQPNPYQRQQGRWTEFKPFNHAVLDNDDDVVDSSSTVIYYSRLRGSSLSSIHQV